MTSLGTLIFGVTGVLFVAGIVALIWLATRDANNMTKVLQSGGWAVERGAAGSATKWSARRVKGGVTTRIDVVAMGVQAKSVWTHVRTEADTGDDDVLVERKAPAFMAADGKLAAVLGFTPPPRWNGATAALNERYNAYASSDRVANRWLSAANQRALLEHHENAPHPVNVRVFGGEIEARWAREPRDATQLEAVVALLESLLRGRVVHLYDGEPK